MTLHTGWELHRLLVTARALTLLLYPAETGATGATNANITNTNSSAIATGVVSNSSASSSTSGAASSSIATDYIELNYSMAEPRCLPMLMPDTGESEHNLLNITLPADYQPSGSRLTLVFNLTVTYGSSAMADEKRMLEIRRQAVRNNFWFVSEPGFNPGIIRCSDEAACILVCTECNFLLHSNA